jgi:hypothetical protein
MPLLNIMIMKLLLVLLLIDLCYSKIVNKNYQTLIIESKSFFDTFGNDLDNCRMTDEKYYVDKAANFGNIDGGVLRGTITDGIKYCKEGGLIDHQSVAILLTNGDKWRIEMLSMPDDAPLKDCKSGRKLVTVATKGITPKCTQDQNAKSGKNLGTIIDNTATHMKGMNTYGMLLRNCHDTASKIIDLLTS